MATDPANTLIIQLESGPVTVALRHDLAPNHVARIKDLANQGFYDGLTFHRVIEGFVAQGGCPKGNGTGGSGKKLSAEFNEGKHVRGTLSMARAGHPDSADSQFFICLAAAPFLDGDYTVWGEVTDGMELVDGLPRGEPPRQPGKIVRMRTADAAA